MRSEWTDDIARHYAETYGEHASHPIVVGLADPDADDVVVDVGCGSGNVLRLLEERVTSGVLTGFDPSEEMVRQARARTPAGSRVTFGCAAAHGLPVDDRSVTLLLAVHSVHHWDDIGEGLDEVRRVLAPGGRLLICFEEHYDSLSGELVAAMLRDMGFSDIEVSIHPIDADEDLQVVRAAWPALDE